MVFHYSQFPLKNFESLRMIDFNENILTTLKILIIGESHVGKTNLLWRFIHDRFEVNSGLTLGVDLSMRTLMIGDQAVKLSIWDTAGAERFRSLMPMYFRSTQGAVLVYDVSNRATFLTLEFWLNELEKHSTRSGVIKIIVGNKIDKDNREVTWEEGIQFARLHHTLFVETSAKTSDGVQFAFEALAQKIIETPTLWESTDTKDSSNGNRDPCENQSCCACRPVARAKCFRWQNQILGGKLRRN